jgi:hypothetical protein
LSGKVEESITTGEVFWVSSFFNITLSLLVKTEKYDLKAKDTFWRNR